MVLNIKGTLQEYYYMVLFQLRAIPPYHRLQTRESELLSHLLAIDVEFEFKGVGADERSRILFGYDVKMIITEQMKLTDSHYRNLLQKLKQKGFITNKNLDKKLQPLRSPQQITINFTIQPKIGGNNDSTENIHESNNQRAVPA